MVVSSGNETGASGVPIAPLTSSKSVAFFASRRKVPAFRMALDQRVGLDRNEQMYCAGNVARLDPLCAGLAHFWEDSANPVLRANYRSNQRASSRMSQEPCLNSPCRFRPERMSWRKSSNDATRDYMRSTDSITSNLSCRKAVRNDNLKTTSEDGLQCRRSHSVRGIIE
jgi:hypothetical protein